MHSVFRLPWSSEPVGDKFSKSCNGIVEFPFVNKLKRKLVDTAELSTNRAQRRIQPIKRSKPNSPSQKPSVSPHKYRELGKVAPWSAQIVQHPLPVYAPTIFPGDGAPAKSSLERSQSSTAKQVQAVQSSASNAIVTKSSNNVALPGQTSVSEQTSKPLGALPSQTDQPSEHVSATVSSIPLKSCAVDARTRVEDDTKVNTADRVASMREMIESHFDYEILLKHREVQLIEQELAKCQISLEQLRRCHLIPYPGTLAMSEDVSNGIGPALQTPKSLSRPERPAPWGVADGPYSRHYAKWLVPDPRFDALSKEEAALAKHRRQFTSEGRATRASLGEFSVHSLDGTKAKARLSRTSAGKRPFVSGTESPTSVRDRQLPLVIKRSTDGQYVKLVCSDCHRGNFSSAQGFLNHCRIAHHRDYKSHDAAAVACGQPIESDTLTNISISSTEQRGQTQEAGAQVTSPCLAQQLQPLAQPQANVLTPSVHPLIHGTGIPSEKCGTSAYELPPREFGCNNASGQVTDCRERKPETMAESRAFVFASETPHLSALLQKREFGGNLQAMVTETREIIDMASVAESSPSSDLEEGSNTKDALHPLCADSNDAKRSGTEARARMPESSLKKVRLPRDTKPNPSTFIDMYGMATSAYATPISLAGSTSVSLADQASTSTFSSDMDFSPNTAESSNPGLVSDRDDDFIDDDDLEQEEEHAIGAEQLEGMKRNDKLETSMTGIEMSKESPAIRVACVLGNEHDDAPEGDLEIGAVKFATKTK